MNRILLLFTLTACSLMLTACTTDKLYKTAASKSNTLSTTQVTLMLAEAGDPHYQYQAGLFYEAGTNGFQQDIEQAVYWYQAATEHKYLPAYARLGVLYEFGRGLPRDKNTAVSCYEAAALPDLSTYADNEYYPFIKMEMVFAQQQLGRLYSSGDGIKPDYVKGYMWNKIVINHVSFTGNSDLDQSVHEFQELSKLFNAMLDSKISAEELKQGEFFYQKYFNNHSQWHTDYTNIHN